MYNFICINLYNAFYMQYGTKIQEESRTEVSAWGKVYRINMFHFTPKVSQKIRHIILTCFIN